MAASGAGAPSDGVVRNSALSFVAPAQDLGPGQSSGNQDNGEHSSQADRLVPAGLKALCDECSKLYPDQPNPLQVTTRLKYWLGGEDPLDYISMYWNPGIPDEEVPPHWHYVSFGLSDLHGDGRVHGPPSGSEASGFGHELTFRLAGAGAPPLWPAALLQALARYIFATGNKFCAGDHISWHAPLGAGATRVRHLLVAADAKLTRAETPHGHVEFLQLVGCTTRELRAAQRTSGFEVLKLLQEDSGCGGRWLVTQVCRRRSARAPPSAAPAGSPAHLAGVSARVLAEPWTPDETDRPPSDSLTPRVEQEIKETLQRGLSSMSTDRIPEVQGHMSTDSFEMSSIEKALPHIPELMQGSWRGDDSIEYLDGVHLILDPEGASLLPLAIEPRSSALPDELVRRLSGAKPSIIRVRQSLLRPSGRVLHDRHFTYRCGARAVTLLSPGVAGAVVTPRRPYAARGPWIQILIPKEFARTISAAISSFGQFGAPDSESDDGGVVPAPPRTLEWPRHRLKISVD